MAKVQHTTYYSRPVDNNKDLANVILSNPNSGCPTAEIALGHKVNCTGHNSISGCPFPKCVDGMGHKFKDFRKAIIYGFHAGMNHERGNKCLDQEDNKDTTS